MRIFRLFIKDCLILASLGEIDRNNFNVRVDSLPRTVDRNMSLIDIDHVNIFDSEEIFPDPDEVSLEIEALNKRVYQLISLRKQKEMEKENETKTKLIERDRLLRQIVDLELFTQEEPKSKEEGPVIRENLTAKISSAPKVVAQTNREVHSDPQPTKICADKGKHNVVETGAGSKIADVISRSGRVPHGMSLHEVEIEKMRKEKENLQRELEKFELEATNAEVRRKIDYLKAPPITFPSTDQSYPNHVPIEMRDKLHKFAGNNAISADERLNLLGDMINDYEIANENVIMKLFVQSLVEDAQDWYRGLPMDSIETEKPIESETVDNIELNKEKLTVDTIGKASETLVDNTEKQLEKSADKSTVKKTGTKAKKQLEAQVEKHEQKKVQLL
ncbi:uncharacterized protein LOC131876760 [Cryptomeria japonica]|uniref:uncharacterized protein LOC131876760 n=1 Tax=Cryptomeria japonica TaxID=3369 RepID=UPI0027D9EB2B|nr:uncharacterized protein LOC131876760 [Cryptomeria japonica]